MKLINTPFLIGMCVLLLTLQFMWPNDAQAHGVSFLEENLHGTTCAEHWERLDFIDRVEMDYLFLTSRRDKMKYRSTYRSVLEERDHIIDKHLWRC